MKKFLKLILLGVAICSISACGKKKENVEPTTVNYNNIVPTDEASNVTTTKKETTVVEEATSVIVPGDNLSYEVYATDKTEYTDEKFSTILLLRQGKVNASESNTISEYVYDGSPVKIDFEYERRDNIEYSSGYYIYINGVPHKYAIEENGKEEYMHVVGQKMGKGTFSIYVTPTVGQKGDKLMVYLQKVHDPLRRPRGYREMYSFLFFTDGHFVSLKMNAEPKTCDITISDTEKIKYTEYEYKELTKVSPSGQLKNDLTYTRLFNASRTYVIEDNKIHFFTEVAGGTEGEAMCNVFLNGKLFRCYRCEITDNESRVVIDEVFTFTEEDRKKYDIKYANTIQIVIAKNVDENNYKSQNSNIQFLRLWDGTTPY